MAYAQQIILYCLFPNFHFFSLHFLTEKHFYSLPSFNLETLFSLHEISLYI